MFSFWGKSLDKALDQTKLVKVHGVIFRIKRIDPFNYMDGSNSVVQIFQTYEQKREMGEANINKLKEHYRDVLMSGVVEPKLIRKKEDGDGMLVDNLFTDWGLTNELYSEIMSFTYGKKKRLPT